MAGWRIEPQETRGKNANRAARVSQRKFSANHAKSAYFQRKSNFKRKSQRKFSLHAFVLRSSAYAIRLQDAVLAHLVQDIIGLILIKPTQLLSFLIRNRRLMLQIFENPILCLNLADRLILHMRCLSFRWSRPWASGSAHWPRTSSAVDGRFSWVSKGVRVASGDLKMQRILKHLTEPTGERQRPFGTRLCLQSLVCYTLVPADAEKGLREAPASTCSAAEGCADGRGS